MRLRYTQPALADLDAVLAYIAGHSPQGAARVHARIQTLIDLLLTHPNIGARTDDHTIRRLNTFPYPYLVFYEVAGEAVFLFPQFTSWYSGLIDPASPSTGLVPGIHAFKTLPSEAIADGRAFARRSEFRETGGPGFGPRRGRARL